MKQIDESSGNLPPMRWVQGPTVPLSCQIPIAYYDGTFLKIDQPSVPKWDDPRPNWNTYLMTMAFLVAQRSLDKHTKHGCVLADSKHAILSTGYNSAPRAYPDRLVDLERPGKYLYMEHSERNAIANAARHGIALEGATCYITGYPCSDCYRMLWQSGIRHIIYAPISLGATYEGDHLATVHPNVGGPTLFQIPQTDCQSILQLFGTTLEYFTQRIETPTT